MATNSKMKSWGELCSSDDESDDGLHPARLAPKASDDDISFDDSLDHISYTGDEDLDEMGAGAGKGNGYRHEQGRRDGGRGGRGRGRNNQQEENPSPQPIDFDNVPADVPSKAPFTAYIRNLCYKIDTANDLADKIEGLTRWRYRHEKEVKVINARLGLDRSGNRKGFGYVEFGTVEEVSRTYSNIMGNT